MTDTCRKCFCAIDEDDGYVKEYSDEVGNKYDPPLTMCMKCYLKSKERKVSLPDPSLGD